MVKLKDILEAGYTNDPKKQQEFASKHGFKRDNELSNHNHQVYTNGSKILYNINGTQNGMGLGKLLEDWRDNASIGLGYGRKTDRFKEERGNLEAVERKYNKNKDKQVHISGHSKAGFYAGAIAKPHHQVVSFNKASTGEPTKRNEQHYRTYTDPVSLLALKQKHTRNIPTLTNPLPLVFGSTPLRLGNHLLDSHNLSHLTDQRVF